MNQHDLICINLSRLKDLVYVDSRGYLVHWNDTLIWYEVSELDMEIHCDKKLSSLNVVIQLKRIHINFTPKETTSFLIFKHLQNLKPNSSLVYVHCFFIC